MTEAASNESGTPRRRIGWFVGLLLFVELLVFGRSIFFEWVMWDDPAHVLHNPLVKEWFAASWRARLMTPQFGYPIALPVAIYAAAWEVFGANSAHALHGVSVLLHLLNSLLVFVLARRWWSDERIGLAGAAVWSLHPIVCEVVGWISDLNELLLTTGVLAALYGWERLLDEFDYEGWSLLVIGTLVAVASKPTALVVGPLLVVRLYLDGDDKDARRSILYLVGVLVSVVTVGWALYHQLGWQTHLEPMRAGLSSVDRAVAIPKAAGVYVRNYLWPLELQPTYYQLQLSGFGPLAVVGAACLLLGAILLGVSLWKSWPIAWPLSFVAVTYLPYSNIRALPRFVSDTYMYLPTVGVALGVGAGIVVAYERLANRPAGRRWLAGGVGLLLVAWTSLSSIQIERWSSTERLFAPLLGSPSTYALPYGLIAYDKYRSREFQQGAALLEEAWPRLKSTRALPRIAPAIFLRAGWKERAAEARLRVAAVYGAGPREWVSAFDFLLEHDLPPPSGEANRLFWKSMMAWRRAHPMASRRLEAYFREHGGVGSGPASQQWD